MNREEIMKILPHRRSMLLTDSVVKNDDGTCEGRYKVRGDEWFLDGHFPGNPVVPGVILCEMMAQNSCVLIADYDETEGKTPYFTGLDKVKFRGMVRPGDEIVFVCRIKRVKKPFYFAEGKGSVNGKECVSGEFSFALID